MTKEDRIMQDHIINCTDKHCSDCKVYYRDHFITDANKRAVLKYQQTDKFKDYRRRYYQRNREEILRKAYERNLLRKLNENNN